MNYFKYINLVLIVSTFCFCNNPFATRKPEPPSEDRSSWVQPTTPQTVIENLKLTIIEGNLPNYMKCLTDSNSNFHFIPDELVNTNNQRFFDQWNLSSEQNYIAKVFTSTADSVRKATINIMQVPDYQDSVFIKVEYELELNHNIDERFPKIVKGQAEFWLNENNGEWFITRWTDFGTADVASWSSLKVRFSK